MENTRIREFSPLRLMAHTSRPVVYLSLGLNYALGGLNPFGYHIFNILIHILAALVLYGILRRTFRSPLIGGKFQKAAASLAGTIAVLWALHPLQTESVTYTIQRGESLMGLLYLLTLYCVIRAANRHADKWWAAAAVASCLLGMGSKGGVMLTAPVIALIYDRIFLSGSWWQIARTKWVLYAGLAATWLSYPAMLSAAPEEWKESAGFGYGASPLHYAMTQPRVILHYLRLALWPDGLCLDYGWPLAASPADVLPFLAGVAILIAATVCALRKAPAAAFLGIWLFIILLPTSSFVPIADVAVEHRMYLPLAAPIAAIVIGLFLLIPERSARGLGLPAIVLAVIALMFTTISRNTDYSSKLSIWRDAVAKSPASPRAQYDLAESLEETGNFEEALVHYQAAVNANPNYADGLTNLGHLLVVMGRPADGLGYLQKAIRISPGVAVAHNNLGLALARLGKTDAAKAEWKQALRLKPDFAEPHNNLGVLFAQAGDSQDAIEQWQEAVKLDPGFASAHVNLAYILSQQSRNAEAVTHYEQALAADPGYFDAQIGLATELVSLDRTKGGDPNRAVTLAEQACSTPAHHDAACLDKLAHIYAAAKAVAP